MYSKKLISLDGVPMNEKIREIIAKGEGINIEFKEWKTKINKAVYHTVCSFLNRVGGEIVKYEKRSSRKVVKVF